MVMKIIIQEAHENYFFNKKMTTSNFYVPDDCLFFITLKSSMEINENDVLNNIFDQREYSDIIVKGLIYMIDRCKVNLYGFVILSNQIHLIVSSSGDEMHEKIEKFKRISAREILIEIGKNLGQMDDSKSRGHIGLRKVFGSYLNKDESIFWGRNEKFLPIQRYHLQTDIMPITSAELLAHLSDDSRNYLQLGASAFTKVMLENI